MRAAVSDTKARPTSRARGSRPAALSGSRLRPAKLDVADGVPRGRRPGRVRDGLGWRAGLAGFVGRDRRGCAAPCTWARTFTWRKHAEYGPMTDVETMTGVEGGS